MTHAKSHRVTEKENKILKNYMGLFNCELFEVPIKFWYAFLEGKTKLEVEQILFQPRIRDTEPRLHPRILQFDEIEDKIFNELEINYIPKNSVPTWFISLMCHEFKEAFQSLTADQIIRAVKKKTTEIKNKKQEPQLKLF